MADQTALLLQFQYELCLSVLSLLLGVPLIRLCFPFTPPLWFLPTAFPSHLPLNFWLELSVKRSPTRFFFLLMDLEVEKPSSLLVSDIYLSGGKNKGEL